jgi:ABC-type uncharacterized transport system fused permease/ATPase subunit
MTFVYHIHRFRSENCRLCRLFVPYILLVAVLIFIYKLLRNLLNLQHATWFSEYLDNRYWANRKYRGKTCPSATLSTTNPTWNGFGLKPALDKLVL